MSASESTEEHAGDVELLSRARAAVVESVVGLGHGDLADDAALVASELVTNAVLHGGGCRGVEIFPLDGGVRIEVRDRSHVPPMLGRPSEESLTGRGLRLVAGLSSRWGADAEPDGKVVWVEIVPGARAASFSGVDEEDLLTMWDDGWELDADAERRFHIELGDVPTDLLLAAKLHVDNVVREFTLAATGAQSGTTAEIPPHLASLIGAVVDRFADARLAIKRQALDAARRGDTTTRLSLQLPASAADAAQDYARALDEVDSYCRARRLLTLETPPQHRLFRHWYIDELVNQLRAAARGEVPTPPQSFARRLLREIDRMADAQRASERAARLYGIAVALARAATPEAVAQAVLDEGVAALGASRGVVLLATDEDHLLLPGAVGYDEAVLERLRNEPRDAELPAAVSLRTGEPVRLTSRDERDERFPELAGLEASTVSLCAVPLEVQGQRLGALQFSFDEARLFDENERRFVLALAAQTAQALQRAQLQLGRIDVSRWLQRSLLPPTVPAISGLDVAAIYHPFGDGLDVGGDFYDMWPVDGNRWAIAIGDAAGTGPEAAVLTALVRHTLRALTMITSDPAQVMRRLNRVLLDVAPDPENERFCTALFGLVTTDQEIEVWVASGGHPPPLIRRADGRMETVSMGGSLLGVFPDPDIESIRVRLGAADTLVMVTDGVLEARRDSTQFDVEGITGVLAEHAGSAASTATALEQAVLRHTGGSLTDDLAAVVLHVPS